MPTCSESGGVPIVRGDPCVNNKLIQHRLLPYCTHAQSMATGAIHKNRATEFEYGLTTHRFLAIVRECAGLNVERGRTDLLQLNSTESELATLANSTRPLAPVPAISSRQWPTGKSCHNAATERLHDLASRVTESSLSPSEKND